MPLFRRRQDWSTLALVLALLPCLLACGDDDDDSGSGPKNADDDDDAGPFPDDDTGGDDDDLNDDSDDDVDDDSADDDTGDDDTHDDDTGDDDTGDDDTGDDDADDDTADDDTGDDDTGDDDTGDDDVQDPIFLGDIAPNEGNNVLSKTVLITGDGFVNGMELAIGGVPIDDWTLVNEQTLIAVLPSGLPAGLNSLTAAHGAASGEGVLDGAYTVDDVIDTYAVISGHVYDRDGLPLQNVRVSSTSGGSATTPSNGFYAFSVPRQSTNVRVSYNAFGPSFLIPKGTLAQTAVNGEALDEDLELDFQIDYDFLHGTVLDADGAPVPNAIVQAFEFNQLSLIDNEMVTDENGEFTMPLFPKTYAFRVDPLPDPSEPGTFVWEFPLDGDGTANWNLHEGNSITGRVLDRDGSGIGPFQILPFVLFKEKSTAFFLSAAISDESGNWSTLMEPGLYEIRLFGMHTDDHLNGLPPFSNPIFATLDVDGPANVDIQFDYAVMDVQITSGGVPIDFPCELNLSSGFNEMRHFSLSAEDAGFVSVPVWKMPLSGAAYPPASSGLTATFSDFGDIAGDDSLTLELEAGERVYGTVTANGIDPLDLPWSISSRRTPPPCSNRITPPSPPTRTANMRFIFRRDFTASPRRPTGRIFPGGFLTWTTTAWPASRNFRSMSIWSTSASCSMRTVSHPPGPTSPPTT
ncbi:MAG: carboxypeptidase-like regulatory domain-containing protein [Deltaproteobacteria bacterium]|nr:carboxypeptidase-like regulatory domain-containing protein [Deltaproteobacteria bacterium]